VKTGQVVKVKVLEVDAVRKRIALSMRLDEAAARSREAGAPARQRDTRPAAVPSARVTAVGSGAMADALALAFKRKG
jgi:uncharacterized protein